MSKSIDVLFVSLNSRCSFVESCLICSSRASWKVRFGATLRGILFNISLGIQWTRSNKFLREGYTFLWFSNRSIMVSVGKS